MEVTVRTQRDTILHFVARAGKRFNYNFNRQKETNMTDAEQTTIPTLPSFLHLNGEPVDLTRVTEFKENRLKRGVEGTSQA